MTMHRELIAAKREPDCWINVHDGVTQQWLGAARETREQCIIGALSLMRAINAKPPLYRLKVYLKPGVQS